MKTHIFSSIRFFIENKAFLKRISRSAYMQRYNGVIDGEQTCEEILFGNWRQMAIFHSWSGFNTMETSECFHFTADRRRVYVISTGMHV